MRQSKIIRIPVKMREPEAREIPLVEIYRQALLSKDPEFGTVESQLGDLTDMPDRYFVEHEPTTLEIEEIIDRNPDGMSLNEAVICLRLRYGCEDVLFNGHSVVVRSLKRASYLKDGITLE